MSPGKDRATAFPAALSVARRRRAERELARVRARAARPTAVEAARAAVAAAGEELDDLEALPDWSPEREAERQDLLRRYFAARRAVEEAELEEDPA